MADEHTAVREPEREVSQEMAARHVRRLEAEGISMKLVDAHRVLSRECTDKDAPRIAKEAFLMHDFFGEHTVALAHPQVNDKDPLRFFVLRGLFFENAYSTVIVNPRIVRHVNYTVDSSEGCHTWPQRLPVTKQRWRLIEVEYQVLTPEQGLSGVITETLKGLPAFIFQHELDHLNGIYCYDL